MIEFKKAVEKMLKLLPDWATGSIRILNNQELVAYRSATGEVYVKTHRCVQCGECCLDVPDGHMPWGSNFEGKCNKLTKEDGKWVCKAGHQKPDSCLYDSNKENMTGCKIEYI